MIRVGGQFQFNALRPPESSTFDLFRLACEEDLEGIVAKRMDGLYTPEETGWVKIRNPRYSQTEGRGVVRAANG